MSDISSGVRVLQRTWGSNVYLVEGPRTTVIDAGFPMDHRRISRVLGKNGGALLLVATHYHLDHMGSMRTIADAFDAEIAAQSLDADVMEGRVPYEMFKVDLLRTAYYKALGPLFRYRYVEVQTRLEEGDVIDALGGLEVIHVPGHTRGSIALYQKETGILFSGDTIRNERGVLEGPPPTFSPGIEEAYWNIRNKILPLDFEVLFPGHGDPVTSHARGKVELMMHDLGRME